MSQQPTNQSPPPPGELAGFSVSLLFFSLMVMKGSGVNNPSQEGGGGLTFDAGGGDRDLPLIVGLISVLRKRR